MRKQILQCFLLNGIILGVSCVWYLLRSEIPSCLSLQLSILLFDYLFLPAVQALANFLYSEWL